MLINLLLDYISLLLINEIEEAVFINNRRWDIKLKNGINLRLSENNISSSLTNFEIIYKNVSNRELLEIESIDLRIPKQAILKFKEKKDD